MKYDLTRPAANQRNVTLTVLGKFSDLKTSLLSLDAKPLV